MLEVENLTLRYGQSRILHGIDLVARPGEVTAVMGMNGVGKTSLLKAIAGRHPFDGGRLRLAGRDLGHPTAAGAARAGIAYVPQGREIFPLLTVQENLEAGLACLPRGERRVDPALLELFPILRSMAKRRGGDLSGGQQQQLAIARALVTKPRILLLDEPTEGIQPSIIKEIGRVIEGLRDRGDVAVILVEQFFDFAHALADRVVVLRGGAVAMAADPGGVPREELLAAVTI